MTALVRSPSDAMPRPGCAMMTLLFGELQQIMRGGHSTSRSAARGFHSTSALPRAEIAFAWRKL